MSSSERNRGYRLPKGCKDLADVLKAAMAKKSTLRKRKPLETNEQIRQILQKHIPELANGTLEIVSAARVVGRRCLIVVRPTTQNDSPVRMFSMRRGPQLDALIDELASEFPSISLWNGSAEEFVRKSFRSPELQIAIKPEEKEATVTLNMSLFDEIHGKCPKIQRDSLLRLHSEMVQLVSEVTGFKISLQTER